MGERNFFRGFFRGGKEFFRVFFVGERKLFLGKSFPFPHTPYPSKTLKKRDLFFCLFCVLID